MPDRSSHSHQFTPQQRTSYDACPHHFRIHYSYRCDSGDGDGAMPIGVQQPRVLAADEEAALEKIRLVLISDIQAAGYRVKPDSFVITVDQIEQID